jgi:hypothetical protein
MALVGELIEYEAEPVQAEGPWGEGNIRQKVYFRRKSSEGNIVTTAHARAATRRKKEK